MKTIFLQISIFIIVILSPLSAFSRENISQISISYCSQASSTNVQDSFLYLKSLLERRTSIIFPEQILFEKCEIGQANIWWFDEKTFLNTDITKLKEHIYRGGAFIVEANEPISSQLSTRQRDLIDYSIGLNWENPLKNGLFYRSFYLLQSLDGCPSEHTQVLTLRKKANAQSPVGLITSTRFFSEGNDCFGQNQDYKIRSFINMMLAFITTDYKEDQKDVPEILNRIRNLGLEP